MKNKPILVAMIMSLIMTATFLSNSAIPVAAVSVGLI